MESTCLDRAFGAVVCDWDGTLVPDRRASTRSVRALLRALSRLGVELVIVSGTGVDTVLRQLRPRELGPGTLHVCANRGSEVFRVTGGLPVLIHRRHATSVEDAGLDRTVDELARTLAMSGLPVQIVRDRLNRRKLDLLPEPQWCDPPKARIAELLTATTRHLQSRGLKGLDDVLGLATEAVAASGIDARITTDAKHVEIGLTDKADAMRWALDHLAARGIPSSLVLVAGDEMGPLGGLPGSDARLLVPGSEAAVAVSVGVEPAGVPDRVTRLGGGPPGMLALLARLRHRLEGGVPDVDDDPRWLLRLAVPPVANGATDALATVADGRIGTRGTTEEDGTRDTVLVGGTYTGRGSAQRLLAASGWTHVRGFASGPAQTDERTLDLRTGILLRRRVTDAGPERSARFAAIGRTGLHVLRVEARCARPGGPVLTIDPDRTLDAGHRGSTAWARLAADPVGGVAAAGEQHIHRTEHGWTLDRRAAFVADPARVPPATDAVDALHSGAPRAFAALVAEQRAGWTARWAACDIGIEGDEELQRAIRFALLHINAAVHDDGECAVGARALTGPAYGGHVFWDADVFVLPVLAATRPAAARAMLEYRVRRLASARAAARARRRHGARFPWESARDGTDVTPREGWLGDRVVPIRTGQEEEHIVADVAWAACQYAAWSGDDAFLHGPGRALVLEAASYWQSRVRVGDDGHAHIEHVIGPDEYHEGVDDDVFTNVMARWTLRQAVAITQDGAGATPSQRTAWRDIADHLVDGFDPTTGIYEQFRGYHRLAPPPDGTLDTVPIAADLLLGLDRVRRTQIIKQPDVLMAHHLVPGEMVDGSLVPNLAHYETRTAHGSSLSPAIHASLLARASRTEEAVAWLRRSSAIDLDDVTGSTADGLHLAALAGMWHAIVFGFLGARMDGTTLRIDPRLPSSWPSLTVNLRVRGAAVRVRVDRHTICVHADAPVSVALDGADPVIATELTWSSHARAPLAPITAKTSVSSDGHRKEHHHDGVA